MAASETTTTSTNSSKPALTLGFDELCLSLKKIETDFGRTDEKRAMGIVPIDLDVLRFDDQLLHLRDWERPYVKNLISEL